MALIRSRLMASTVLSSSSGDGVAFRYCASVCSASGASKQMSLPGKYGGGR